MRPNLEWICAKEPAVCEACGEDKDCIAGMLELELLATLAAMIYGGYRSLEPGIWIHD